jgi:hypothetical protein
MGIIGKYEMAGMEKKKIACMEKQEMAGMEKTGNRNLNFRVSKEYLFIDGKNHEPS